MIHVTTEANLTLHKSLAMHKKKMKKVGEGGGGDPSDSDEIKSEEPAADAVEMTATTVEKVKIEMEQD